MSYAKSLKQELADLNKPSGHKTERHIMKKTTSEFMLLAILTVSCPVLTACQPSDPTTGPSSEHSCEFGAWTVIEQAICTKAGHSYSAEETEPTCTRQGYTTHTCGSCGNSYVDTYIDGTHDFKQSDTCEGWDKTLLMLP